MKKLLIALPLIAVTLTGCSSGGNSAISNVSPKEFADVISNQEVQVIDVRLPEEYQAGHLENAQLISVEASDFEQKISTLDKTKTYAVYCRSGRRSTIATQKMAELGFTNLVNLQGGFEDLANLGLGVKVG
jgi:rhodanese-related sulfurtransferase